MIQLRTLGAPRYGPFGPPFRDRRLQATYEAESYKLADNLLVTEGTARDLVATVINAALAAGESSIPKIKREVTAAVKAEIPGIERKVKTAAGTSVKGILLGVAGAVGLGLVGWGMYATLR